MKQPISIVITTYNSQDFIKDCLKSVSFADEILIVDNGSSDQTIQIAKKFDVKILPHKNNPKKLNESKNYGFSKAKNDWVLSLDSDERVEKNLKGEIEHIVNHSKNIPFDGYLIPRKNIIFGKQIQHGLWYPDYQLRLFRKGKGKFPNIHNHELLELKTKPGTLAGHILHENYQTITQFIQKIDKQYSENEAEVFLKNKGKIHWYDAIRFPFQDFLTNYFMRQAYKDGLHGLMLSLLQAFYMLVVFAKIWEKQGFKKQEISLQESQKEFKRIGKQIRYWFIHEKSAQSNIFKKIWYKIQNIVTWRNPASPSSS